MEWKKIGHRGASGHVAENTLESIQKALEFEVDAIEVDVHRCKSSELVVIHDLHWTARPMEPEKSPKKTFLKSDN